MKKTKKNTAPKTAAKTAATNKTAVSKPNTKVPGNEKQAAEKPVKIKKAEKVKVEKRFTKACILLACTSEGTAMEEQVNFQWSLERLYSRNWNLQQTFEMVLPTAKDMNGFKNLLSEILKQIRTLKLGGVNIENIVVAYQHKLTSNPDFALFFVRKLSAKGIRVHFVNDSVLPPHLQKLKAGLNEIRQAYQYALELWYESVNR